MEPQSTGLFILLLAVFCALLACVAVILAVETKSLLIGESASADVERAMKRRKSGKLKSGKGGKGGTVKSRKQAIAIGLSEARKKGKKVPPKKK